MKSPHDEDTCFHNYDEGSASAARRRKEISFVQLKPMHIPREIFRKPVDNFFRFFAAFGAVKASKKIRSDVKRVGVSVIRN